MSSTNVRIWVVFALLFGTVALASGHFENPDAHLRLSQAFSLWQGHGFELGDGVGNPRHGNLAVGPDGRRFSVYNPGQIVLFVPSVIAGSWLAPSLGLAPHYAAELLASFLGVMVHLLTGLVVFVAARTIGRPHPAALLCAAAFVFATFNLPSARDGYEHTYEALALIGALAIAWKARHQPETSTGLAAAAGTILGLGILFRTTTLLGLPALLMTLPSQRGRGVAVAALLPFLAVIGIYNTARLGSPFDTGYVEAWQTANAELATSTGFSLWDIPTNAMALWLSPGKGLLVFSPVLLLALLGIWRRARALPVEVAGVLMTCLAYTCLYGANFAWHGSAWCWGPRYLAPLPPLLAPFLPGPSDPRRLRRATLGIGIVSVVIQCFTLVINYKRHLLELLLSAPEAFENGAIFYNPLLSPVLALPRQFTHYVQVLQNSGPLYLFHADGPWRNEGRPVGISTMLDLSIDLNAFDLWWIRLLYFPIPAEYRLLALAVGLSALTGLLCALQVLARSRSSR